MTTWALGSRASSLMAETCADSCGMSACHTGKLPHPNVCCCGPSPVRMSNRDFAVERWAFPKPRADGRRHSWVDSAASACRFAHLNSKTVFGQIKQSRISLQFGNLPHGCFWSCAYSQPPATKSAGLPWVWQTGRSSTQRSQWGCNSREAQLIAPEGTDMLSYGADLFKQPIQVGRLVKEVADRAQQHTHRS